MTVDKIAAVIGVNSFKVITETSENLGVVMAYIDSLDVIIKYYYTEHHEYNLELIKSNLDD